MQDLSFRAPISLPIVEGATTPVPSAGNPIIWSDSAGRHLHWDGEKWAAFATLPMPLSGLVQGGASVGDSIVWDGTSWVAGQPIPGSWTDAYAFLMDAGNTGTDLETYLGVSEQYFGFTALLARYEWITVCNTGTAAEMFAASSTAMTAVAASSTAMTAVTASSTAMAAVIASSSAISAVASSAAAMAAVAASSTALASVASSATAMAAMCNSQVAIDAVFVVPAALTALRSSTALTSVSIPTMTSNAAPSGIAAVSTNSGTSYAAWKALDKSTSTAWVTANGSVTNQWLSYDFTAARFIHRATVQGGSAVGGAKPNNFRIEYSDDNSTWTSAFSGAHTNDTVERSYDIARAGAHRYWRLFLVDRASGGGNYIEVAELNLFGFILP